MSFGSVSKQETGVFPGKRSKQIRSEISCKENKDVAVQNYLKRKKKKEKKREVISLLVSFLIVFHR